MSKIISIGTALPAFKHEQPSILQFMQRAYALSDIERRQLRMMYAMAGIDNRYSVISDYSKPLPEWKFYPQTENLEPFPSLEQRMTFYNRYAAPLSVDAIRNCMEHLCRSEGHRVEIHHKLQEITHLITVSCTGMSAPGLDLQVMDLLDLPRNIYRTSINFMGCYAALHGLKMADHICRSTPGAMVLIVCTELCTLHFQREATMDNMAASLLFGDGSAAVLVTSSDSPHRGIRLLDFYSEIIPRGKKDMAWELSSTGFLMTLSGYLPDLIEEDLQPLIMKALSRQNLTIDDIGYWCIHPGGRKILEAIERSLSLPRSELHHSYEVLRDHGNMSSPTILFVLEKMFRSMITGNDAHSASPMMGAAFGPGLTMETFIASAS